MCYNTLNTHNISINRHILTNTKRFLDVYEEKNPYIRIFIYAFGDVLGTHLRRFFIF